MTWTSTDKATSLYVSGTLGTASETSNQLYSIYSMVFQHHFNERTHLVLQHDQGFADGVLINGKNVAAEWYGINSELFYDINDELKAGIRAEWFRDQTGFRVFTPQRIASGTIEAGRPNAGNSYAGNVADLNNSVAGAAVGASYYEFTAGFNWKPKKWLNFRPQARYDFVDSSNSSYAPFANNKKDQFLFSTDVVITF